MNFLKKWFKNTGNTNPNKQENATEGMFNEPPVKSPKSKKQLSKSVSPTNPRFIPKGTTYNVMNLGSIDKIGKYSRVPFILTPEVQGSLIHGFSSDAIMQCFECSHKIATSFLIEDLIDMGFEFVSKKYRVSELSVEDAIEVGQGVIDVDVQTNKPVGNYLHSLLKHKTLDVYCFMFDTFTFDISQKPVNKKSELREVARIYNVDMMYSTEAEEEYILECIRTYGKYISRPVNKTIGTIFLITQNNSGLAARYFPLAPVNINFDKHYNEDFKAVNKVIVDGLSQPKSKGIVLLHGIKGSGKTTYIKYLTSLTESINKPFIFLPTDLTSQITSPSFIEFLIANSNSIIVIEDGENILKKRTGTGSGAVSTILNLGDGLLSDCLNIQFIITFNTKISEIDDALTRKGRLIASYEFSELTLDRALKLVPKKLHKEFKEDFKKGATLADTLHYKSKHGVIVENKPKDSIGFGK